MPRRKLLLEPLNGGWRIVSVTTAKLAVPLDPGRASRLNRDRLLFAAMSLVHRSAAHPPRRFAARLTS